jgi:hypothetical protein
MKKKHPHSSFIQKIALLLLAAMVYEIAFPTVALALTSGPVQPEFSSFEPVATTNMVNENTGDFTYNLPLLNVPGPDGGSYPLSLSYHSGSSPEEEASWVGYGWTLNPGAVTRAKKGFADDYKGASVKYWNQVPANKTVSIGGQLNFEAASFDVGNVNGALRYNNYRGFGYTIGGGVSADGMGNFDYSYSDGEGSFSVSVSPTAILDRLAHGTKKENAKADNEKIKSEQSGDSRVQDEISNKNSNQAITDLAKNNFWANVSIHCNYSSIPTQYSNHVQRYQGTTYHFSVKFMPTVLPFDIGVEAGMTGSISIQNYVGDNGDPAAADSRKVYGYMYGGSSAITADDVMDYSVDKDFPYQKRNTFVGQPFSNADQFNVSGEGLGGGFRLYQKSPGTYRPNFVASSNTSINGSIDLAAGITNGFGGTGGGSISYSYQNSWGQMNGGHFANESSDENVFARFNGDMGGSVEFGSDEAEKASLHYNVFPAFLPDVAGIEQTMNNGKRSGRSSYVDWHTNDEMYETYTGSGGGAVARHYNSYTQDTLALGFVDRSVAAYKDGIGEIVSFNGEGQRYVYGLPVYARNEQSFQYDMHGAPQNNYLAYKNITSVDPDNGVKVGEESKTPYASTHLLTEITSPDYLDQTMNGPTADDFGGWVRFTYKRIHGTKNKTASDSTWYKWRIPYNGLLYHRNELSTADDDRASLVYGEKEIYYLDTIATKTHYAVFVTSARNDAYDAAENTTAANSSGAKGNHKLKKLDRIELYARGQAAPIKIVHFTYYSDSTALCKGLPNAASSTGKLTLYKVWFESEGIINTRIAPYVFKYAYSTADYPSKYDALQNYGSGMTQDSLYSPFNVDAWGNYQHNGASRFNTLKTWVDQGAQDATFDPAAWQLKVIQLPTGGEIHIQYEQDDYAYVQDKGAMAMVSLKFIEDDDNNQTRVYLNTADINVSDASPTTNAKLKELKDAINKQYQNTGNKIYFKFLYSSEYIKGYASIEAANIDANGLYVNIKDAADCSMSLPHKVCVDYYRTQRAGKVMKSGNCNVDVIPLGDPFKDPAGAFKSVYEWIHMFKFPGFDELCVQRNEALSYLRIPMASNAKKGGGLRVKRLLMYDKGLESGDAVLYGNEYDYTTISEAGKKISSGVASDEPGGMREENPMVDFVARANPKFWINIDPDFNNAVCRVISGRDKDQMEGPIGEAAMPGPSVMYSQITIRNIHSGETNTGTVVKQFYTYKDYPVLVKMTNLETKRIKAVIDLLVFNMNVDNIYQTQGFSIIRSNLPGQLRSESTYSGDPATSVASSQIIYSYYEPPTQNSEAEQIPLVSEGNCISRGYPGKECEMVFESREVSDVGGNFSIEYDFDIGYVPPVFLIPSFSAKPAGASYSETRMHTHATTKVINYPAVVKSVQTKADGISHTMYNLAFDAYSGQPILTRTVDGFDKLNLEQSLAHKGAYTSFNIPASHKYPEMGQRSANEGKVLRYSDPGYNVVWSYQGNGEYNLKITGADSCDAMRSLYAGDLLHITRESDGTDFGFYNYGHTLNMFIGGMYVYANTLFGTNNHSSYLTDEHVVVEIVRSGRDNKLSASVGSVNTYGEDLTSLFNSLPAYSNVGGICDDCSNIYSPSNVVASNAMVMSDNWDYVNTIFNHNSSYYKATGSPNKWELNQYGVWRPKANYIFKDTIVSANGSGKRIYKDAGVFSGFSAFNWNSPGSSSLKWIKASEVSMYSPNGAALEETDVLSIYSNAKFGYNHTVPYLVAQNADYGTVQFESFENLYAGDGGSHWAYYEDGVEAWQSDGYITDTLPHSGKYCYRMTDDHYYGYDLKWLFTNQQMKDKGISVKFWIRSSETDAKLMQNMEIWVSQAPASTTITRSQTKVLARTGQWRLMEGVITPSQLSGLSINTLYTFFIHDIGAHTGNPFGIDRIHTNIYLDDVRVQPTDAQMNAYVYDKNNLRVLATFDDQNFGIYYQYNAEGKLIAKKIETEKGIKTVMEKEYNTPMLYSRP